MGSLVVSGTGLSLLTGFGLRPSFFLVPGCWSSARTAGLAFSQWWVSTRGVPSANRPTCTLMQDFPTRSRMGNGPSYECCRGPSLWRFSRTWVTRSRSDGSCSGGWRCADVCTAGLSACARKELRRDLIWLFFRDIYKLKFKTLV